MRRLLDFVCIQRILVTFALVLKLVGEQRLLGSHGVESDLVVVLVAVLPQTVEAVFLIIRLGRAHAPDDERRHHKCRHGGRCKEGQKGLLYLQPTASGGRGWLKNTSFRPCLHYLLYSTGCLCISPLQHPEGILKKQHVRSLNLLVK